MKKILLKNDIEKIDFNVLIKDICINGPISAIIFSLFMAVLTWRKPDMNHVLIFILGFTILNLIRFVTHNNGKHLASVCIDYENGKIIFNHIIPSKKNIETIIALKEIRVSKINYTPISWFSFVNYFWVLDDDSKIKISTNDFENEEINLNELHSELNSFQKKSASKNIEKNI